MTMAKNALVIGAGIIGITTAYALAKSGWLVTIVDRNNGPARGASWGNGRQLSYSHTDALANPHLLSKLPFLALGSDDAFRLKLRSDPGFLGWLACFARNCTASRHRQNTLACLDLAKKSQRAMEHLLDQHPIQFEQRDAGKLVLYRNKNELHQAEKAMMMKLQHGSSQRLVSKEQAIAIEPALNQGSDDLVGAIYSPDDQTGHCSVFAEQLLKLLQRDFSVNFAPNAHVQSLDLSHAEAIARFKDGKVLHADMAVICAGHHANNLLAPLGHRIPVQSMKGYSFTAPKGALSPATSVTDSKRRIVFTDIGEQILVAGIADLGDSSRELDKARMAVLTQAAHAALPLAADYDAAENFWAGHRPITPNSLPITKRLAPALAVNAGHGMLGWTLAMGSASVLADQLAIAN